eukprot:scaffold100249_cov34-Cyclotella_meneghiniana.AAC.1
MQVADFFTTGIPWFGVVVCCWLLLWFWCLMCILSSWRVVLVWAGIERWAGWVVQSACRAVLGMAVQLCRQPTIPFKVPTRYAAEDCRWAGEGAVVE